MAFHWVNECRQLVFNNLKSSRQHELGVALIKLKLDKNKKQNYNRFANDCDVLGTQ